MIDLSKCSKGPFELVEGSGYAEDEKLCPLTITTANDGLSIGIVIADQVPEWKQNAELFRASYEMAALLDRLECAYYSDYPANAFDIVSKWKLLKGAYKIEAVDSAEIRKNLITSE